LFVEIEGILLLLWKFFVLFKVVRCKQYIFGNILLRESGEGVINVLKKSIKFLHPRKSRLTSILNKLSVYSTWLSVENDTMKWIFLYITNRNASKLIFFHHIFTYKSPPLPPTYSSRFFLVNHEREKIAMNYSLRLLIIRNFINIIFCTHKYVTNDHSIPMRDNNFFN
jgi:hypothetical protein